MIKVTVLVYERFRNQLIEFLKSFKNYNTSEEITYKFVIVAASKKPDDLDGCICEELIPYKDSYRLSFIKKIDDILNTDTDLLIIADDRCFCRSSIDQFLISLSQIRDWQLCGSPVDPMFDANLIQDNFDIIKTAFVYLDGGFLILNKKTVPKNLTELAEDSLPTDVQLYTDRVVLNIICDQKIVSTGLFCNGMFNVYRFDYSVVLFDIYRTDENHTADSFDETFIFLKEYLAKIQDKNLIKKVKKLLQNTPSSLQLQQIICDRLMQKQYLYNKYDEVNFNEE